MPIKVALATMYTITDGINCHIMSGIYPINKNTWTQYVRDMRMVAAEENERCRRSGETWGKAQYDEVQFVKESVK